MSQNLEPNEEPDEASTIDTKGYSYKNSSHKAMEQEDVHVLNEAKKAQDHGESFEDPARYQPYLESVVNSLVQRESVLGRYNHITANNYASIGNIFFQMEEARAVVMHRTCYRIQSFLYGQCNGHISGKFKAILQQRGLTQTNIEEIRKEVMRSMKHEMEGDLLRRIGDKKAAVIEYQKAVKIEEFSFGRDNPDLAYLWRKMACLASIKKGVMVGLDFEEIDRIGSKWSRQISNESLHPGVCSLIRRGDKFYQSLLYSHATSEYFKATTLEGTDTRKYKSHLKYHSSSGSHSRAQKTPKSSSRKTKSRSSTAEIEKELAMLLSGNSTPNGSEHDRETSRYHGSSTSIEHRHQEMETIEKPDKPQHSSSTKDIPRRRREGEDTERNPMEAPRRSKSNSSSNHRRKSKSGGGMDPGLRGRVDDVISKLKEERRHRKAEKRGQVSTLRSTPPSGNGAHIGIDSDDNDMSIRSEPPKKKSSIRRKKKSGNSSHTGSKPKSRRMKKPKSEPSVFRGIISRYSDHSAAYPPKPKSESYLSKMASKTKKIAKKKLKKARDTIEKHSQSQRDFSFGLKKQRSFFGSSHTNRSIRLGDDDNGSGNKDGSKKPRSTSYLSVGSPPMTPFNVEVDKKKVTRSEFGDSVSGIPETSFADFGSFAGGYNNDQHHNYEEDDDDAETFANSSIVDSGILPLPSDPVDDHEAQNDGLGQFLSKKESDIEASKLKSTNNADDQSVMTTDETIKERFFDETAQMVEDILDKPELPSLVDLVARVQTLSGLLQRQAYRLQHNLGLQGDGSGRTASDRHLKSEVLSQKNLQQEKGELSTEVERLFDECEFTISTAFARIDGEDKSKVQSKTLGDYRKTFEMEQNFLEELRKGVAIILQSNKSRVKVQNEDDETEYEEEIEEHIQEKMHIANDTEGEDDDDDDDGTYYDEEDLEGASLAGDDETENETEDADEDAIIQAGIFASEDTIELVDQHFTFPDTSMPLGERINQNQATPGENNSTQVSLGSNEMEASMLSIVFEDSSKSASEQPTPKA